MPIRWDRTASFNHAAACAQHQRFVCRALGLKIRIWRLGSNGRSLCPPFLRAAVSEDSDQTSSCREGGQFTFTTESDYFTTERYSFTTAETSKEDSFTTALVAEWSLYHKRNPLISNAVSATHLPGFFAFQLVVGRVSPTFNGTNVDK